MQTTNKWLKEIMASTDRIAGGPIACSPLCCTLCATGSLSTRWPNLAPSWRSWCAAFTTISGITFRKTRTTAHKEESLAAVVAELDDIGPINPEHATHAVFSVLEHHVAPGEIEDIKATLATKLRDFWP